MPRLRCWIPVPVTANGLWKKFPEASRRLEDSGSYLRPMNRLLPILFFATLLFACEPSPEPSNSPTIEPAPTTVFGTTATGATVHQHELRNANGMRATVMTYGAYLTRLHVPDSAGNVVNVVLGFDSLRPYTEPQPFFGATVGRYANRIGGSKFTLNGTTYELPANDGANQLHGGPNGFDKQIWEIVSADAQAITLRHDSPDGAGGFPGNVQTEVTYSLGDDNVLAIDYRATTDQPTILNLTNHAYFNLRDGGKTDILDHRLMIDADQITPVDATLIPTGELRDVAGTPFDFRTAKPIGQDLNDDLGGYDHNFVLNGYDGPDTDLFRAAVATEPVTGRRMECWTTEPGIQLYTANWTEVVAGAIPHAGFCLETQKFPDTPNRPDFPSAEISPEQPYRSRTEYRFGW